MLAIEEYASIVDYHVDLSTHSKNYFCIKFVPGMLFTLQFEGNHFMCELHSMFCNYIGIITSGIMYVMTQLLHLVEWHRLSGMGCRNVRHLARDGG